MRLKKWILAVWIILQTLGVALPTAAQHQQSSLLVDTIGVEKMIRYVAEENDSAVHNEISRTEAAIHDYESRLSPIASKLEVIHSLTSLLGIKTKDKADIAKMSLFLHEYLSSYPKAELHKFLDPKELATANLGNDPEKEISKLEKFAIENLLKRVKKGDFTSPLLLDIIAYSDAMLQRQSNLLTDSINSGRRQLRRLQQKLKSWPQNPADDLRENNAPLNPQYLTLKECRRLMKERGVEENTLKFSCIDPENSESVTVELELVHPAYIGVPKEYCENSGYWIKTSPALQSYEIPAKDFVNVMVSEDFFGPGDDGLIAVYNPTGKDSDFRYDVYRYGQPAPEGNSQNSKVINKSPIWTKRAIGKYDPEIGDIIFTPIDSEN